MRFLRVALAAAAFGCCVPAVIAAAPPESPLPAEVRNVDLDVVEMAFCAAIKDRNPVGVADTFPSHVYSLYCFTAITGAVDTTWVTHRWYRGAMRVADVRLPVGSPHWRTWSRKRILPGWEGEWRVDVVTPDSVVIGSKKFILR
jgi:hypothetical protein